MRPYLFAGRVLAPLAVVSSLLSGCGDASNQKPTDAPNAGTTGVAGGAGSAVAPTNQVKVVDETQLAAITNQFATAQQAQAELISKLLSRIDELEKKDAANVAAIQTSQAAQTAQAALVKAQEQQAQTLSQQLTELKSKVGSLEAGKVLPEIALTPDDAPTTRELDQKIRIAERNNELAAEAAAAKAKESPKLSVGTGGFALASADTNFVLKLRGLVQLDSRTLFDDNRLSRANDGFLLRRARPIFEGTLFRDLDFSFVPEFGGSGNVSIFDAYLNYRYRPELQLRAGKFKTPAGLEQLQSDATLPFNERSLVSSLLPNRNVGVQLWGDAFDGLLSYAAGVFNGTGDGRNSGNVDVDDDKEFAGRLFVQPLKQSGLTGLQGFGFGLGGSYSQVTSNAASLPNTTGGTLPGYATDGQQQFFAYNPAQGTVVADGAQWRLSPQFSYLVGPFGLLGEYAISHQSVYNSFTQARTELEHKGWQISAQWVLTGEAASFNGITPNRPFNLGNGGWGAWQLVGRYGQLDIDNDAFQGFSNPALSARSATSWAVGINWWLNRNARILTSFSHTSFEGGGGFNPIDSTTFVPPATVTAQDENVFFTRLQLSF